MRTLTIAGTFAFFVASALFAQTNTIVGGGYWIGAPIPVAPGQVITLFVSGIGRSLTQPVRAGVPLPTTLAGISVTLRQIPGAPTDIPVPLFEVRPVSTCPMFPPAEGNNCGSVTAVSVEIPYELRPICLVCASPITTSAYLYVTENDSPGTLVELLPLWDQVHILTSCDVLVSTGIRTSFTDLPCSPIVTHADGTLVSATSPAKEGEQIVAYAFGLGLTSPPAATGKPAETSSPTVTGFRMDFDFRPNALPTKPTYILNPAAGAIVVVPAPVFSGLTQGFVGLYQINFVVPPAPPGTPSCASSAAPGGDFVQSNLTVSVGSTVSFDGAGICVAPVS